jgi:GDP-L-fucose synthase
LIRKFLEAKESALPSVEVWGTGSATREFLYVRDAAEGIVRATLCYEGPDPVNLGTGAEIRICELVEEIRRAVAYQGEIVWNSSRPDGQPRRRLDVEKARKEFAFEARTDLKTGLAKTIRWYKENRSEWAHAVSQV